jgi:hypothetical protein
LLGVVLADLVSACAHLSLVSAHLVELPALGVAFAGATVLLTVFALVILCGRSTSGLLGVNGLLLVGLSVGYVVSRTAGLPVIGEGVEPWDSLGVVTQFVQALGLLCIVGAQRPPLVAIVAPISSIGRDQLSDS